MHNWIKRALHIVPILVFVGCASIPDSERIDDIPMYGQPAIARPAPLRKLDEEFIRTASAGLGGREKASIAWWREGDAHFNKGETHLAMRRYNQSWLLNPDSFRPYWGFGRVMLRRGNVAEALTYFDRALQLCDDNYQKVALLSDAGTAYSGMAAGLGEDQKERRRLHFAKANDLFDQATKLEPEYGQPYLRWAQALAREGRYAEALDKAQLAKQRKAVVPDSYISELMRKAAGQ